MLRCHDCKGSFSAGDTQSMCDYGIMLAVSAAREFNSVIDMRRKALKHGEGIIYACPDISKHGEAYALTATLFHVNGIQEELF